MKRIRDMWLVNIAITLAIKQKVCMTGLLVWATANTSLSKDMHWVLGLHRAASRCE